MIWGSILAYTKNRLMSWFGDKTPYQERTPYVEIFYLKKKKKKTKTKNKKGIGTSNFVLLFFYCTTESQPCLGHFPIK